MSPSKNNSKLNTIYKKHIKDVIKYKKSKKLNKSNYIPTIKNIKLSKNNNNSFVYKNKVERRNNISLVNINKDNIKNKSTNIIVNKLSNNSQDLKNSYNNERIIEFKKSNEDEVTNTSKKNVSYKKVYTKTDKIFESNKKMKKIFKEKLEYIKLNNYLLWDTCQNIQEKLKLDNKLESCEDYYEFKDLIGKGNFGKVYLAKQILTNNSVAIKTISKSKIRKKDNKNKVELEISLLKTAFGHNNIIKLYECFENSDNIYLVFEYCSNGDILKYIKEKGIMNEIQAMRIMYQILLGLKFLHDKNIFHRDIKLDNILLGNKLKCLIGDFGISLFKSETDIIIDTAGTPAYLAPEILKAKGKANFGSDVWSCGILLYSVIFGTMPFKAKNVQDVYQLILKGKFKFQDNLVVSDELYDLIKKMLTYNIDKRPSVTDILNHKWFKPEFLTDLDNKNKLIMDYENLSSIKIDIIKCIFYELGFDFNNIEYYLKNKNYNHLTACFYVLYNDITV